MISTTQHNQGCVCTFVFVHTLPRCFSQEVLPTSPVSIITPSLWEGFKENCLSCTQAHSQALTQVSLVVAVPGQAHRFPGVSLGADADFRPETEFKAIGKNWPQVGRSLTCLAAMSNSAIGIWRFLQFSFLRDTASEWLVLYGE